MYSVVEVPSVSGAGYTQGFSINSLNQVVGADFASIGAGSSSSFLWQASVTSPLNVSASPSEAVDINDASVIVGAFADPTAPDPDTSARGYLLSGPMGSLTLLQSLLPAAALSSSASAINKFGIVVGGYLQPPDASSSAWSRAFVYDSVSQQVFLLDTLGQGVMYATGINNNCVVIGECITNPGYSYNLTTEQFIALSFKPSAINASGVIVGTTGFSTGVVQNGASLTPLPSFGGDYFVPTSINASGAIVGSGTYTSGPHGVSDFNAFLTDGGTPINLNDELSAADADWHLWAATNINDQGVILARARRASETFDRTVVLTPNTPDPRVVDQRFWAAFAVLIGGVPVDGGGYAIYGGRAHPIPPWGDPGGPGGPAFSPAQREVMTGLMVNQLASSLGSGALRTEVERTASRLVVDGGAHLLASAIGEQQLRSRARPVHALSRSAFQQSLRPRRLSKKV